MPVICASGPGAVAQPANQAAANKAAPLAHQGSPGPTRPARALAPALLKARRDNNAPDPTDRATRRDSTETVVTPDPLQLSTTLDSRRR